MRFDMKQISKVLSVQAQATPADSSSATLATRRGFEPPISPGVIARGQRKSISFLSSTDGSDPLFQSPELFLIDHSVHMAVLA